MGSPTMDFGSLGGLPRWDGQSLSPQDYLMMRSLGFVPNGTATGGNVSSGPFNGSYKQFSDGVRTSEMGDARLNIPLDAAAIGFGAGVQRDPGQGYSVMPGANASAGPFAANYNRTFGSTAGGDSYGAALKVGDIARLNYQRTRPGGGMPATDAYGVSIPVGGGGMDFSAALGGAGGPQYRAGLSLGDILGGELSVGANYAPSNRGASAFASFRKQF